MSAHNFLPSRRFFLALLGIGALLILTLVLLRIMRYGGISSRDKSQKAEISLEDQVKELQEVSVRDTDKDGLKDWEEGLWGLNPNAADTDNDGISDFDQVVKDKARIKAENVALGTETDLPPEEGGEELNATDQFSRDLYTTVSLLQQDGSLADNQGLIANRIIQTVEDVDLSRPVDIVQLNFVDTTQASALAYIIAMGNLLGQYPIQKEELTSIFTAISQDTIPESLTTAIQKYQTLATEMEKVAIPLDIQTEHVNLINATRGLVGFLQALSQVESDPLITMAGVKNMSAIFGALTESYTLWYQALNIQR